MNAVCVHKLVTILPLLSFVVVSFDPLAFLMVLFSLVADNDIPTNCFFSLDSSIDGLSLPGNGRLMSP